MPNPNGAGTKAEVGAHERLSLGLPLQQTNLSQHLGAVGLGRLTRALHLALHSLETLAFSREFGDTPTAS